MALFTFLYIDLLDCTGTLLSMASLLDDVMTEDAYEEGALPGKRKIDTQTHIYKYKILRHIPYIYMV